MIRRAFTMVELLVTISVVGVLSAFTVGQFSNVTREASLTRVKSDLKVVRDGAVQYYAKTEKIPVNSTGIGVSKSDFKLSEGEYVIVNLELLSKEQVLEDGTKVLPAISKIPYSARYTKAGTENRRKQEPSFVYVMDKDMDIYLAEGNKDKDTGYFIYTKVYETKDASEYDSKTRMYYAGNKPIVEEVDTKEDNNMDDSTIVDKPVVVPPNISTKPPSSGNSGVENTKPNVIYYKNLSVAGFAVFVDLYDIDFAKLKSLNIDVQAGANTYKTTLFAVKSTRWFGRINASNLNNYSGDYNCRIHAITKDGQDLDVGSFSVLIDRTKPNVTIKKSKNDFNADNPITVTLEGVDPTPSSGIDYIEYKINDGDWETYSKPIVLDKVDYYEIQAKCVDKFGNVSGIVTSTINDYTKPEIYITKTDTGAKLNIGVDVDEDDILWSNGFETTDKAPGLHSNNTPKYGTSGGQSISSLEAFEGDRSFELLKNNDGNGNIYFYPATQSNTSRMNFGSLYNTISNNMYLSVVYRYKSYGNSTIGAHLDGGWGRGVYYYNMTVMEDAKAGTNKIKVDKISGISLGSKVTTDTDPFKIVFVPMVKEIDYDNNIITISSNLNRDVKAGEKVAYRSWKGGGSFASNSTSDTEGEWRLFTSIMKTTNYSDYDMYKYGSGAFLFHTSASNRLYIDNVKMGFASKIRLYKDGKRFNTEAQEYNTSYVDNNIPDKANPEITGITTSADENNYNIEIKAKDNGTKYTYYTESVTRSGKVSKSNSRSITTTSGIKKYYYVIDNSSSTTNIPTSSSTTDSVINKILDENKTWYIHVKAEDNAGNVSAIMHKKIV